MPDSDLTVLRILCHKHLPSETVAKNRITGARMILDNGEWDLADDGRADPDDEEISSQEFSSTDSVDNLADAQNEDVT